MLNSKNDVVNANTNIALNILIVDDEINIRKTLSLCLEAEGHKIIAVSNYQDAVTLLLGENGTGKSIFAKAIHGWSKRSMRPFAVVSCPSLSTELLESELFGHVKGAFTGAVQDNPGRIAVCEGGTLLLDEIGDLPLTIQAKLLRFIQEKEYERVGDHVTRKADVRLIAATNMDIEKAVQEGRFREDLYYRLNVITIKIPPLRERPDDIFGIADKLLTFFSRRNHCGIQRFTDEAKQALYRYSWRGNVRELRNAVERASILCKAELIGIEYLPDKLLLQGESVMNHEMVSLARLKCIFAAFWPGLNPFRKPPIFWGLIRLLSGEKGNSIISDDLVKRPDAALRFIHRHCGVR